MSCLLRFEIIISFATAEWNIILTRSCGSGDSGDTLNRYGAAGVLGQADETVLSLSANIRCSMDSGEATYSFTAARVVLIVKVDVLP